MMHAIDAAVGRLVKRQRLGMGYSLEDLASRTNQVKSNICHLESGRTHWSVFRLVEAARALGVSPGDLLTQACADAKPRRRRRPNPTGS